MMGKDSMLPKTEFFVDSFQLDQSRSIVALDTPFEEFKSVFTVS